MNPFAPTEPVQSSRWYRPPSPDFVALVDEELDALTFDDMNANEDDEPVNAAWSPSMPPVESDEDEEPVDVDEEDMHAAGVPAARGCYLDAQ